MTFAAVATASTRNDDDASSSSPPPNISSTATMSTPASVVSSFSSNNPATNPIHAPEQINNDSSNSPTPHPPRRTRSQYSPQRLASSMVRTVRQAIPISFAKSTRKANKAESMPAGLSFGYSPTPDEARQSALSALRKDPTHLSRSTSNRSNVSSPLAAAPSHVSSSNSSLHSSDTSPPLLPQPTSKSQQLSAFSSPLGPPWSIFDLFSALSIRKERPPHGASPTISSNTPTPLSSPETTATLDPLYRKKLSDTVERLVSQYMDLSDCHQKGFVDISTPPKQGRMGGGSGGLLGYSRKPQPPPPCNLYYEVFGTGPKKLFLIMGMIGSTMFWRFQSRYFSNHGEYTVCVFDNRGSGKSTIAPGPYKISQMAKDACKLLDHLGWTEEIHMVGISLGGMVAQEMCLLNDEQGGALEGNGAYRPPRFASVALVDTWHSAALALPTVQEIRFSFKGMAAFGDDPKHLIKLVFSPEWIRSPFHDASSKNDGSNDIGAADGDIIPTNKDVMGTLFRAVQRDLKIHRGTLSGGNVADKRQPPIQVPTSMDKASLLSPLNTVSVEDGANGTTNRTDSMPKQRSTLHHSRSVTNASRMASPSAMPSTPVQAKTAYSSEANGKRDAAGDLHQFIACMGHRLSPQRVRTMRTLNPQTRFLVIHGERDKVIRPFCGRSLAKLLGCPVVWIKTAGHMPLIDAHCTFNLVLRAFTRNERWLRELPDRTCLLPATWDEQVKTRQWIASSKNSDLSLNVETDSDDSMANVRLSWLLNDNEPSSSAPSPALQASSLSVPQPRKRRTSRTDGIQPVGPLSKELLLIDESDIDLAARVIPANVPSPQIGPTTRENTASSFQSLAGWLSPTTAPSSVTTAASSPLPSPQTHEMLAFGVLVDAPFRIRRYSLSNSEFNSALNSSYKN